MDKDVSPDNANTLFLTRNAGELFKNLKWVNITPIVDFDWALVNTEMYRVFTPMYDGV